MRILIFLLTFIMPIMAYSHIIDDVEVRCDKNKTCEDLTESFMTFKGRTFDDAQLKEFFTPYLHNEAVQFFEYELIGSGEHKKLVIDVTIFRSIREINVSGLDSEIINRIKHDIAVLAGGYYRSQQIDAVRLELRKYLESIGYKNVDILISENFVEDYQVDVSIVIKADQDNIVQDVVVVGLNDDLKNIYGQFFARLKNKYWDRIELKRQQEKFNKILFDHGYFFSTISITQEVNEDKRVIIKVNVNLGKRYHFSFRGNEIFDHQELLNEMVKISRKQLAELDDIELRKGIDRLYRSVGIFDSQVKVSKQSGKNKFGVEFQNFYVTIKEGRKIKVENVVFIGNNALSSSFLHNLYMEHASTIARRGYLDRSYLNDFSQTIKKQYILNGNIFVQVGEPLVSIKDGIANVEFEIREGVSCELTEVILNGIPEDLRRLMIETMDNQVGHKLNVLTLQDDLIKILEIAKKNGYIFADILNISDKDVLIYSPDYTMAKVNVKFKLERKAHLDNLVVAGNKKTRSKVILREIDLKRGDVITSDILDEIKNNLVQLGLFSKVDISTFITNKNTKDDFYNVNLLINVTEVDFGLVEIGPGFRTDLGAKLSANYFYNNVAGMNRAVSVKSQVNRRFSNSGINTDREHGNDHILEFELQGLYSDPYMFKIPLNVETEASIIKKRYHSFDANIGRLSFAMSKRFFKRFGTLFKYQYENIKQYNAYDEIDDGDFKIGGLTAIFDLDFRDSNVNPKKGAYFQLSNEYASPELLSMDTDELKIHFYKFAARAQFYVPVAKNWVIASSLSYGYQKNLSGPENYIPSIKVFRLNGMENVRGFDDDEINILNNGVDIADTVINESAYYANLKFEPRYYATENTVMGLFIDGGAIDVNQLNLGHMRFSTGVTFKYVTPVGSIDFDYGIKLNKKESESVGRFHLSVGFF